MTVGNNSYNYDYNTVIPKKKGRTDIDLDSLMHQKNIQNEKNRIEQKERAKSDSLILMQNQELKKEMDKLRKELQKFREEIKDPQMKNNDGAIKKDTSNDADIFEI
jgi:hypothetical protein